MEEQGFVFSATLAPGQRGGIDETVLRRRRDLKQGFYDYTVKELGRSPRTGEVYLTNLKTLERFTSKPIEKVTADDLREFKKTDYSPAYKQSVIVAARQFHAWGAMEGHWPRNGIMDIPTPRNPREHRAPLSVPEARRLLDAARTPAEVRATYLGLYAGTRAFESASIRAENWGDRLTFTGKGAKKRSVPVHPCLQEMRDAILAETPASKDVLIDAFTHLRDRIDARDLEGKPATTHSLRRTFASQVYDRGAPWEVVQKLLGHGGDVTSFYARITWDKLVSAVMSLDYSLDVPVQLSLFG